MSNINVYCGDFRNAVPVWPEYKCIITDIPDNNGLGYKGYYDKLTDFKYRELMFDTFSCIDSCQIMWVSLNPNHMNLAGSILHEQKFTNHEIEVRWFMQAFAFGYYLQKDFGKCFRPFVRIMRKGASTYPDSVRVESARQRQNDKRADPRGKIATDVWIVERVTGNSHQRRKWHPTQIGTALYERCLDFSCVPGDTVADIFCGTGTCGRAAEGKGLEVDLFDISEYYCKKVAEEFSVPVTKIGALDEEGT